MCVNLNGLSMEHNLAFLWMFSFLRQHHICCPHPPTAPNSCPSWVSGYLLVAAGCFPWWAKPNQNSVHNIFTPPSPSDLLWTPEEKNTHIYPSPHFFNRIWLGSVAPRKRARERGGCFSFPITGIRDLHWMNGIQYGIRYRMGCSEAEELNNRSNMSKRTTHTPKQKLLIFMGEKFRVRRLGGLFLFIVASAKQPPFPSDSGFRLMWYLSKSFNLAFYAHTHTITNTVIP